MLFKWKDGQKEGRSSVEFRALDLYFLKASFDVTFILT